MKIEFEDGDSIATVVNAGVIGYTVRMTFVEGANSPTGDETMSIVNADHDSFTICEADSEGAPIPNSTWTVFYDDIDILTII